MLADLTTEAKKGSWIKSPRKSFILGGVVGAAVGRPNHKDWKGGGKDWKGKDGWTDGVTEGSPSPSALPERPSTAYEERPSRAGGQPVDCGNPYGLNRGNSKRVWGVLALPGGGFEG